MFFQITELHYERETLYQIDYLEEFGGLNEYQHTGEKIIWCSCDRKETCRNAKSIHDIVCPWDNRIIQARLKDSIGKQGLNGQASDKTDPAQIRCLQCTK